MRLVAAALAAAAIVCKCAALTKGNLATDPSTGGLRAGVIGEVLQGAPAEAALDVGIAVVVSLGTASRQRRSKMLDEALGLDTMASGDEEDEVAYVVGRATGVGGRRALVLECGPADSTGETAGLAASCAHCVVVSLWRSEVGRGVTANANVLRTLRETCRARSRHVCLIFAVHDDEPGAPASSDEVLLQGLVSDLEAACGGDLSFCRSIDVVAADTANGRARLASALEERLAQVAEQLCGSIDEAAALVATAWDESRATVSIEDVSAFVCDSAAARCRELARAAHARWRRDVDDGRLAPRGWASECAELVRDVIQRYCDETIGYWTYPGRAEKRTALETFLVDEARRCHLKQLDIASSRRLRRLRSRLERAAAGDPSGELDPTDSERIVADAEASFDLDASRCEVPSLGLVADSQRAAFRDAARRLAADFAETPAAQLLATKAEAKRAKAATRAMRKQAAGPKPPKAPRKPPALSYALQLVGMLRPKGYGNLQGFCNYAIGPHSILFGYSDDRDVGGDMTVADNIPLLRFQPKLTLDVDL